MKVLWFQHKVSALGHGWLREHQEHEAVKSHNPIVTR